MVNHTVSNQPWFAGCGGSRPARGYDTLGVRAERTNRFDHPYTWAGRCIRLDSGVLSWAARSNLAKAKVVT